MPRDDRNYGKDTPTYMDHDVKPFDRKAGNRMLGVLMGGEDIIGKRGPEGVKNHIAGQGARALATSRALRPDLSEDDQSPGDED